VVVVLVAKFTEGAWITLLLIPGLIWLMRSVKQHYDRVAMEIETEQPANAKDLRPPLVVLPLEKWDLVSENAIRFAWTISPDLRALHVECGEDTDNLCRHWGELVETPARQAGLPVPELVLLPSPFRFVVSPIVDYVVSLEKDNQDRQIAVLVPELVESRWYYSLLHNNRSEILKAMLLFKGSQRITVVTIPWQLKD